MMSEEDKARIVEARSCNSCLDWHHHCNAECCRIIFLNIDPKRVDGPGKYLDLRVGQLGLNEQYYYRLRDVSYVRGLLRFQRNRLLVAGQKVMYIYDCALLDGCKCKGHPDDKPELCKRLTVETALYPDFGFGLTDNCLFKYKHMEIEKNETVDEKKD